jgi:hypothetical protein
MGNDRVRRVLSVPGKTMTAAIDSLPKRPGAGQGYSPGPHPRLRQYWGRRRNQCATVPIRQNTTSYPTPVVGCLSASKSP